MKLKKGDIFYLEKYKEKWEYISNGFYPSGEEYLNFKIIEGKMSGAKVKYLNKGQFDFNT